jgi:hypothetical protein
VQEEKGRGRPAGGGAEGSGVQGRRAGGDLQDVTQGGRCRGRAVLQERRTRGDSCVGAPGAAAVQQGRRGYSLGRKEGRRIYRNAGGFSEQGKAVRG